jgi:decaprenylphospho-beta-D-ribofuranose 2-oxidase
LTCGGEFIDDVSTLNRTEIDGALRVAGEQAIRNALERAAEAKRKVAIAGARHSQGGQIAAARGTALDTRSFNRVIGIDELHRTIVVEPGATWNDVQVAANPLGLAVAVQQASNVFTVGGSLCRDGDPTPRARL